MALLKQSTAYTRTFFMVSSSDHLSAKTGAAPTVNISKAGGAFGAAAGTVTEIANGWYKIALTTADTNTLGDLAYHITGTGADDTDFVDQVSVRITDDLAFPNISGRGVDVDATGGVEITVDQSVNVNKWLTVAPNALIAGRVDANAQVVGDKSGYSLTQAFPANFASLSIDISGRIDLVKWVGVAVNALIAGNVPANTQVIGVDVLDATALALSAGQEIADRMLARNLAGGSDAGRVVRDAFRALRNKVDAVAGIVYQEDDATTAWTFVITTAAGNPVTIVDPT